MVYYRKYRPQKISELDSQDLRERLFSIFSKDLNVHAFLFTGSKGLGKTSTARIIAKTINCEKNQELRIKNNEKEKKHDLGSIEPCNKCVQCTSITNGSNLDVLEIDGASNRGIDEIRDLREKIRLSPVSAIKKVYIIDEVHMLTTEAFNALLKTLEEPPSHALFILCTTEFHKVPETIISRCFHIPFKKAGKEELIHSLSRIVKVENLKVDSEVLEHIAKLADGGFRDATKILEELVLLSKGEPITNELVENKYQISNTKTQISKMIEQLSENDTKGALRVVSEVINQGTDMKYFIEQMINELHEELLIKVGIEKDSRLINPSLRGEHDSKLTIEDIKKLVELLTKAHSELKYAILPQLPLELVIIEYTLNTSTPNVDIADRNTEKRKNEIQTDSMSSSTQLSDKKTEVKVEDNKSLDTWQELLKRVKVYNHSIAGVLRGCLLKKHDDNEAVLETSYKFHKDKLEDNKTLDLLEKVWREMTGKEVKFVIELKK